MNAKSLFLVAAAALAFHAAGQAQSMNTPAADPQASVADEWTDAEVRKVDGAKVTLKHGEIKNLGMPPMAMVFEAKDPKAVARLKAGDKVRFRATHENGKYMLRDIELAK
jgi:Cu/Ag efflux protein CusF